MMDNRIFALKILTDKPRYFVEEDGLYSPLFMSPSWSSEQVAVCYRNDNPDHICPNPRCKCGLYCYDTPEHMLADIKSFWHCNSLFVCLVELYGRIIVHEFGMRSERAQLVSVLSQSMGGSDLHSNALRYNAIYGLPNFYEWEILNLLNRRATERAWT